MQGHVVTAKDYLIEERNRDLMRAYDSLMRSLGDRAYSLRRPEIIRLLLELPAPKFYILPEEGCRQLAYYRSHGRFKVKSDLFKEKYMELLRRFDEWEGDRSMRKIDIINEIVNQQAPRFYLNEQSAALTIQKLLNESVKKH